MDKNIIKKHLTQKFVNEAKEESGTPGITVTDAAKKESSKENKKAVKDMDKELADYDKSLKKGMDTTKTPNKFNYSNNEEVEYHRQMEIMNGQEMIQYDRDPITEFKERAKEAIEGSSRMGNNPEWANVVPEQMGFTGPDFGKNLVKSIESSFEKRMAAEKGNYSFGDDIENESRAGLKMTRFSAIAENNDNNKPQIKETMKRLKFKNEFKGVGNALKMIPESYKVDNKVFEMTDGVENYKIRWEGSLTEGKAVVLMASDKNLVNEDMQKMKRLMGYKSQETLGAVKGKARLDENAKFTDIWKKTRTLMEMEDIEDADAKEGNWDEISVPQAADAKKHIEGSVSTEKGTKAPKPKTGEFEKIKKHAPEATKHVTMKESVEEEGVVKEEEVETTVTKSSGKNIEDVSAEENYWEKKKVPQASEAKKHVHMGKESKAKLETEGKEEVTESVVLGSIKFEPMNESWMEETMDEISTGLASKAADVAYDRKIGAELKDDKFKTSKYNRHIKSFSSYLNPEVKDAILKVGNISKHDDNGVLFGVDGVLIHVGAEGAEVVKGDLESLDNSKFNYIYKTLIPMITADFKRPTKNKSGYQSPSPAAFGAVEIEEGMYEEGINEEDTYKEITQYGWKVYEFLREMFPEVGEEERMIKILESAIRITKSSI